MRIFGLKMLCGLVLLTQVGCGGGTSFPASPAGVVTRNTEPTLTSDALILAASIAETPWVSLETARKIEADLTSIRTVIPDVKDVHARQLNDPHSLIIVVKPGTAWLSRWREGTLATGDSVLDTKLAEFRATGVSMIGDSIAVVTFDQWMNVRRLSLALASVSPDISSIETNGVVGDGDRISEPVPGVSYTFSRGWGDCPAGCISRHTWNVKRTGDTWSVTESGDPIAPGL